MARDERFAFKRLEVYRTALDYYGWVLVVFQRVKKADLPLADQVRRQAQSIVHNTAEGAGHWRPGNKRKYYGIARASTFEAAAALDLLRIGGFITADECDEREAQLAGIGAALTRLCQRYDAGAKGTGSGRRPRSASAASAASRPTPGSSPAAPVGTQDERSPTHPTTSPTLTTKGAEHV